VIVFWQKKIKVIAIKIIRAEQKMPNLPKSRTFVAANRSVSKGIIVLMIE